MPDARIDLDMKRIQLLKFHTSELAGRLAGVTKIPYAATLQHCLCLCSPDPLVFQGLGEVAYFGLPTK